MQSCFGKVVDFYEFGVLKLLRRFLLFSGKGVYKFKPSKSYLGNSVNIWKTRDSNRWEQWKKEMISLQNAWENLFLVEFKTHPRCLMYGLFNAYLPTFNINLSQM